MQAAHHQPIPIAPLGTLTNACESCVGQCQQIIKIISARVFSEKTVGGSSVGAHLRHIIERFDCFLTGYPVGQINYDLRRRDRQLELNIESAKEALIAVASGLSQVREVDIKQLSVMESVDENGSVVAVDSTVERELMGLVSHTIHHLAIIVMLAKAQGYTLNENLGKAPSTIIYERQNHEDRA